jgi:2'-5' RNA ligase
MSFRAFIALDIGERIDWSALRGELAGADRSLKLVRPEQLHATLRFLGDVDEGLVGPIEGVMRSAVEGVAPFTVTFAGAGAFPSARKARVVWIGMRGAGALELVAASLERGVVALGLPPEGRAFKPHVTCARARGGRPISRLEPLLGRWAQTEFGPMEVASIALKRSVLTPTGPIYDTVLEARLPG